MSKALPNTPAFDFSFLIVQSANIDGSILPASTSSLTFSGLFTASTFLVESDFFTPKALPNTPAFDFSLLIVQSANIDGSILHASTSTLTFTDPFAPSKQFMSSASSVSIPQPSSSPTDDGTSKTTAGSGMLWIGIGTGAAVLLIVGIIIFLILTHKDGKSSDSTSGAPDAPIEMTTTSSFDETELMPTVYAPAETEQVFMSDDDPVNE
jgi:hypothetical protein